MAAFSAIWLFIKGIPPWVYLVIAIVAGVFFYGERMKAAGEHKVHVEWDAANAARVLAENNALVKRTADNQAIAVKQEANNSTNTKVTNEAINKLDTAYTVGRTVRLHIPAAFCDSVAGSAKTESASGSNATLAGTGELSQSVADFLYSEAERADKIVEGYRSAQRFITDNEMAP